MSAQLVSLLLLVILAGVSPVRIFSGTTRDHSVEYEDEGDVPPDAKHNGFHMMNKLSKDAVYKQIDEWSPNMKQNIWELSGLHEGDIMEPMPEMVAKNALRGDFRWHGGEVPYQIHSDFDEEEKRTIRAAMDEFHNKSCVRFRPYKSGDSDFVQIRGDKPGCWSFVGRLGGGQVVNLQSGCVQHGTIIHELLHALGFYHQHSASNRDDYVKINCQNIQSGLRHNFKKYSSARVTDYGVPYDYGSIMHYSSDAASCNGKPTIIPLESGASIGKAIGLSDGDTNKLNKMYGCGNGNRISDPTLLAI